MPINKEDDYYASVKQDDNSTKPEKTTKKRVVNKKIIVRKKPTEEKSDDKKPTRTRKPYVKKQPDNKKGNLSEEKNTDKKTGNNKTSTTRKPRPNPKGKPNQKSNVSKVRREVVKNTKYKSAGTGNGSNAKPGVKREVGSNPNYRGNSQSRSSGDNSASGSSNSGNSGGFSGVKKVFTGKKSFPKGKAKPYISKKEEEDKGFTRSKKMQQEKRKKDHEKIEQILVSKKGQTVEIPEFISVKEYSDKIGIPLSKVIAECMKNGILANLNTPIDFDTGYIIGEAFDIIIIKAESNNVSTEAVIDGDLSSLIGEEDPDKSEKRSPIISVMGHVDHGKTSILDYIRKSSVASGEAGGITQSVGAYVVSHNNDNITFLDTPGHEAFTIMRSRGAKLTDIAIIVVAADEGIKPQTIESINHAKAAEIPIIVAINKMDKEGANPDLVKSQMAEQGVMAEDWGGDVPMVPVSAHTGEGIDDLLDIIALLSEMQELIANPDRQGIATVIESHLDASKGVLTTVLVNTGTVKKGDNIACSGQAVRIRELKNFKNKNIKEAGPSEPVLVMGLKEVVNGGDILQVVKDPETAKERAKEYIIADNARSINKFEGASLELLMTRIHAGSLKKLNVVLKTDTNGSLEAMKESLSKLSSDETRVNFIHSAVGDISESDVVLAGTSQAILIGYNVSVGQGATETLNSSKIEFIKEKVIYHVLEKVEKIITGMIDIKYDEVNVGEAKIGKIFYTGKDFYILGLVGIEGKCKQGVIAKIIRKDKKVGEGKVESLKSGVEEVKEILFPAECGIRYEGGGTPEEGDVINFREVIERK